MKIKPLYLFSLIVFSTSALGGTVSLLPSTPGVTVGGSVSVDVIAGGLSDLYAFQFDVIFNPAVLSAISVTEGGLFSGVGVFFSPGTIDNSVGTITFIGDSLSGPGPGISIDGTLAQILFNAVGTGSSGIDVSNVVLLDSNLNDIAAGTIATSVDVSDVPEPGYLSLLLAVILGYIAVQKLKSKLPTEGF